ncbi:hypothetical protein N0V88_002628 [Collariella sp. IMI 366227]|nr:hypothetical protein N0V88_002628 [Collariella sp. IMI 366227]
MAFREPSGSFRPLRRPNGRSPTVGVVTPPSKDATVQVFLQNIRAHKEPGSVPLVYGGGQLNVEMPRLLNVPGEPLPCWEPAADFEAVNAHFSAQVHAFFGGLHEIEDMAAKQSPDEPALIGAGGLQPGIRIANQDVDNLPVLNSVTELLIVPQDAFSGDPRGMRPVSMRTPLDVATRLPQLRRLLCPWLGEHFPIPFTSGALRIISRVWAGPWRDDRAEFARGMDQAEQVPDLVGASSSTDNEFNNMDPVSLGLRELGSRLEELDTCALITPDLFPSGGNALSWARMRHLRIEFHPCAPDGSWYFSGPREENPFPTGFAITREEHYPPGQEDDDETHELMSDEKDEYWDEAPDICELRQPDMFRIRPIAEHVNPLLLAYEAPAAGGDGKGKVTWHVGEDWRPDDQVIGAFEDLVGEQDGEGNMEPSVTRDHLLQLAGEPAMAGPGGVGDSNYTPKEIGAGVSTKDTCPFTFGLDVGARLFARAQAPGFNWPGAEVAITPAYKKPIIEGGTCPDLGSLPTKRGLDSVYLAIDGNATGSHSHGHGYRHGHSHSHLHDSLSRGHDHGHGNTRNTRALAKRAAVWGPVLSVPVGSYFCPPDADDSAGEGSPCSQIGYAWDDSDFLDDSLRRRSGSDSVEHALEKRATGKTPYICSQTVSFRYPTDTDAKSLGNDIYGFKTSDCKDYEFGLLTAEVAGVSYDSEHVLEAQVIRQFFEYFASTIPGPYDHPDPDAPDTRKKVMFCEYLQLLWNYEVVIPGLESAAGTGVPLTAYRHVITQFPTDKWKTKEYVRLKTKVNTPAKGNAWGGEGMPVASFPSWLGLNANINKDPLEYVPKSKIATIDGAEKIMKSMRAIIGSRLYHNTDAIQTILKDQAARVGEALRRLDTEVLPNTPKKQGWATWAPLDLKGKWDAFMKSKMTLVATKSNFVTDDILPRMQTQWADAAAREAAKPNDKDDDATKKRKEREQRLIDTIDTFATYMQTAPAWQNAFEEDTVMGGT